MSNAIESVDAIESIVRDAVAAEPIVDMHAHLYPPAFGTPSGGASGECDPSGPMLWGVDELLTYHYLIAEVFSRRADARAVVRAVLADAEARAGRPRVQTPVRRARADQ